MKEKDIDASQMLAELGTTVAQAQEQKFFASFFKKEGLPCLTNVSFEARLYQTRSG